MHKEPKTDILSLNKQAMESLRNGYTAQALKLLKAAEKQLISGPVDSSPAKSWAITLNNLGCYYKRVQKPVVALHYLEKALDIEEKSSEDGLNLAGTHLNMCAIRSQLNDHKKALTSAANAIKILSTYPERTQNVMSTLAIAHQNAGLEYSFMNQRAEAAKYFQLGWNLAKEHLGASHHLTKTLRKSYLAASENSPSSKFEFINPPRETSSHSYRKPALSELPRISHKQQESSNSQFGQQYSRKSVSYDTNSHTRYRKTAHSKSNSVHYYRNSVDPTMERAKYRQHASENKKKQRRRYAIDKPENITPRRLLVRPIKHKESEIYYVKEPCRDSDSISFGAKKEYKKPLKEFNHQIHNNVSREFRRNSQHDTQNYYQNEICKYSHNATHKKNYSDFYQNFSQEDLDENFKEIRKDISQGSNRGIFKESTKESTLVNARNSFKSSAKDSDSISIGVQVIIPDNIGNIREKAALNIQRVWRGYYSRRQEKVRSLNKAIHYAEQRAQDAIGELQRLRSKKESMYTVTKNSVQTASLPMAIRTEFN